MMFSHPVLGVGVGAFIAANGATSGSYVDAHSAFVQIAAELGIIGIATFLVMIAFAFKSIWRRRRALAAAPIGTREEQSLDAALATAALCSLVAELTAAAFLSMAYEAMTLFALTVPVALAMANRASATQRSLPARGMASQRRRPQARPVAATPPRVARTGA